MTAVDETRRAPARPDMLDVTDIFASLAAAASRIGTVARLSTSEEHAMTRKPGLDRNAVLARWGQANSLLMEALAEFEQTHQRLEAGARHIFQAVGNADDRAENEAGG